MVEPGGGGRVSVAVGDLLGERYKLIAHLGGGAMGQVFLAEDQSLGSRVAVKVLNASLLADKDYRLRFRREAQAVAIVDHPNVARFLDLGLTDPVYLVMEFADGPTLRDVIKREGRVPPRRTVAIIGRLSWALYAVHKTGVIHRDLKPANVVLVNSNEGESPKLIDFGLAKMALPSTAKLTRAGEIVGTPHYMAPELIAGRVADARCDVYALGAVMYQMLTGHQMFPDCVTDLEVLDSQVKRTPTPIRELVDGVSPVLEAVVERALRKLPDERFPNMIEMAHALRLVEKSLDSAAPVRPPTLWARLQAKLRR